MAQTKLENLINPEVMADMISASLEKKIKFSPLATIDRSLENRAGNTITVPAYEYIGDAENVSEGVAMGTTVLTASSTKATVKKAGKACEITDEAVLSGLGDPIGEATEQLAIAIASKIDEDCIDALESTQLTVDKISEQISYNGIVDAVDIFEEEDDEMKVIFVHPKQVTTLRKDPNFISRDKFGGDVMLTGAIGMIAGCQVVKSKRVRENREQTGYENHIIRAGALTIYLKRDVEVEDDRDILAKTTVLSADEHYVVVLSNKSKSVKVTFKK